MGATSNSTTARRPSARMHSVPHSRWDGYKKCSPSVKKQQNPMIGARRETKGINNLTTRQYLGRVPAPPSGSERLQTLALEAAAFCSANHPPRENRNRTSRRRPQPAAEPLRQENLQPYRAGPSHPISGEHGFSTLRCGPRLSEQSQRENIHQNYAPQL